MAMPISDVQNAPDPTKAAAQQMEATILRQLLSASGAFKPADVAGGQLRAEMFIETLADAVAKGGGIGIARMIEDEIAKPGAKSAAKSGGHIGANEGIDAGSDDDDPASFAARKPAEGATKAHPDSATTLCAHASQVPVKSGENGAYTGVVHRALNAYQKRVEDTVTGKQGSRTGDAP